MSGNVTAETITIIFQPSTKSTTDTTSSTNNTGAPASTIAPLEPGNCLYSAQLASDPALKTAFTTIISSIKAGAHYDDDDELIYSTEIKTAGSSHSFNEPPTSIDKLSTDCLSCHDGIMAKDFKVRMKNNPRSTVKSLDGVLIHPIGMEYEKYVEFAGKAYKDNVNSYSDMVLVEGKVGCLTCHNPLNREKGHLVMNNSRSELCIACHNE